MTKLDFDSKTRLSQLFSDADISRLSYTASTAEHQGKLTDLQLALLLEKELPYLFVPKKHGGLEKDLIDALPLLEELSYLDGSLGWRLTLIAGAGLFCAFMDPKFAEPFFSNNKAIITGSGFPGGQAIPRQSSYTVSGKWKYATGIEHATLITATCFIENSKKENQSKGGKTTKAFAFYPDEITIHKTWNSFGLKATGSHTFEANSVRIPKKRTFTIAPEESQFNASIYHYPFDAFAHATLAVSLFGMVNRFLDEAKYIVQAKNKGISNNEPSDSTEKEFEQCFQKFRETRSNLYTIVDSSWNSLVKNGVLQQPVITEVCQQSRRSARQAIKSVQAIYPLLGMAVIPPDTVINRCWRDIHTASQHMFLRPQPASL